jgi:DNA-binding SARP family transcriptional activator
VQVRLLGPVEVWGSGGPVDLGAPQQRCVFAALAMTPRQLVSVDALVDRVWGEQIPRNVRTVLYTYVSRLRGVLQQAGGGGNGQAVLRRRDGGYALELDPERVDLHRVRRLASAARAAAGRPPDGDRRAAALLAEACDLWTGAALAGVSGDWVDRVRAGLDHERLALLTERFDAAIRIGAHEAVIGPLSEALAAHPLAESLASLLMLALHRSGRHAEALRVYGQLRQRMVEELGDEPGPGLRHVHERILRRDPELDPPAGPVAKRPGAPWVSPRQLPPDVWHFVGRDRLLADLAAAIAPDRQRTAVPIVTVTGPPGVGKTALATRVAHLARHGFPDGQWHVQLGGAGAPRDPERILGELLEASGVDRGEIPDGLERRTAALRTRLADRRVLLLLDDAAGAAQVRPLLPGTAGAAVLVTSRRPLGGLAESGVRLGPFGQAEALELLGRLAGPERVAAEPAAAAEVCTACGRLPLAVRIAAARLAAHPEWTVERFAARLRDHRHRLDELAVDGLAVRPGLELSYRALDPPLRTALRRLARLGTGEFTVGTASMLAGVPDGERLLEGLVTANLVHPVDAGPAGEPRYRLPELVASFAAELDDRRS